MMDLLTWGGAILVLYWIIMGVGKMGENLPENTTTRIVKRSDAP